MHNLGFSQGCLLGLFVGDATGAPLEFLCEKNSARVSDRIHSALGMRGGGSLNVAPGQVTDDSELAIHLLRGLLGQNPRDGFPCNAVAREYIAWHKSEPFDMGMTIARAFGFSTDAASMLKNASVYNQHSQANGALMRVAPLAVWAQNSITTSELISMARQDAQLSHPHAVCQDASAVFCVALSALISHDEHDLSTRSVTCIQCVERVIGEMTSDVQQWFYESCTCILDDIICTALIGHVKHAFMLAFYFLKRCTTFEVAMTETCRKLGDTDTNCAVVGAMMGALHGLHGIPSTLSKPVLSFDCKSHNPKSTLLGHTRPATYRVRDVMHLIPALIAFKHPIQYGCGEE